MGMLNILMDIDEIDMKSTSTIGMSIAKYSDAGTATYIYSLFVLFQACTMPANRPSIRLMTAAIIVQMRNWSICSRGGFIHRW